MEMDIFYKKQTINCDGRLIDFSRPLVMGILNVTPDSFYAPSRASNESEAVVRAETILKEGGSIIDIGAYSSRPGADDISADEEYRRLRPAVSAVRRHFPEAFLSIDTFRAEIVRRLFDEFGAFMVNDISAGMFDAGMIPAVAELGLPYIAMHTSATPAEMQKPENCEYEDVVTDVAAFFTNRRHECMQAGIKDIVIDPGFGFGKTFDDNYRLLAGLDVMKLFGCPVLVGLSRKSMFSRLLGTDAEHTAAATLAAQTIALQKGADILRVHDVKQARDAVLVVEETGKYEKWDL
ncbi:MAG: dihydropteroate synthase [Prevotellaceae bacterium]|jgi:dihydropteroate synthase|nr:dihydropteroate synthase [Prevotellaceae bacterium]